ncbi:hypothetical protein GEV43_22315 [Actinomadura sp. J1-007]|uniref:hypothetical protein n=1 Tax=Actinomadura sp. J1-007 TaxID=2661913 RepID=UPI00132A7CD9|nr:hypothetical protein [Actinomadura sp. J1-007]MWK36507.1 hypothetical protein [Actinomadura sp. J1-007]
MTLTAPSFIVKNLTTGAVASCGTSVMTGNVPGFQPPNLKINTSSYGLCNGPAGINVQLTAGGLPWNYTVASFNGAVATGSLTGIKLYTHGSDGCDTTIAGPGGAGGTVVGALTNASGVLALSGGNLRIASAGFDCDPELYQTGDVMEVIASYGSSPKLKYSNI